jgi:uncharacterized iron-regulated membrane protein
MLKSLRLFFLKTHLWVGLLLALPLIIMSVTGAILAFEPQIIKWAQTQYFAEKMNPQNTALTRTSVFFLDSLFKKSEFYAKAPQEIQILAQPNTAILLKISPEQNVWIDPQTGQNLGQGPVQIQAFFEWIEHFHRWFALTGKLKEYGKWASGIFSLSLLFLAISGLFLWLPHSKNLWKWVWIKKRLQFYRLWPHTLQSSDLKALRAPHISFGFWALPLVLVISLSGAILSFHPAQNALVWIFSSDKSSAGEKPKKKPAPDKSPRFWPSSIDAILANAKTQVPVWSSMRIVLAPQNKNIQVFISQSDNNKIKLPIQLEYTPESQFKSIKKTSFAQQIKAWNKYTHTGQIFGIATQILVFLGSLSVLFLSVTGLILGYFKVKKAPISP